VLVTRLARDERVPWRRKLPFFGLVGYLALPFDLVPDFIPIAGQLDDAIIDAAVLRHFVKAGGEPLIKEFRPAERSKCSRTPPSSLCLVSWRQGVKISASAYGTCSQYSPWQKVRPPPV
jgi:uncharacterized membrane protein YkvA (DUF1232 family)